MQNLFLATNIQAQSPDPCSSSNNTNLIIKYIAKRLNSNRIADADELDPERARSTCVNLYLGSGTDLRILSPAPASAPTQVT